MTGITHRRRTALAKKSSAQMPAITDRISFAFTVALSAV